MPAERHHRLLALHTRATSSGSPARWPDNLQLFYNRVIVVFSQEESPQVYRLTQGAMLRTLGTTIPRNYVVTGRSHVTHPNRGLEIAYSIGCYEYDVNEEWVLKYQLTKNESKTK